MENVLRGLEGQLAAVPQEPVWHGEGNVLIHTRMVCQVLESLPEYREADAKTKKVLSLAAQLHDIGKIPATRMEDGRWVSTGHGRTGMQMARQLLWQEYGLCGQKEAQQLREAVCLLIRYHSLPGHAFEAPDGKLRLLRFAANGQLAPEATVKNLCILAKADILGRISPDREELLERVELCRELAKEVGCYEGPYPFPSAHTRFTCLAGREVPMAYPLYEDTWGEVMLLSGLPGTGKDTWIRENCQGLPMVSLDEIRKETGILPTENQSKILEIARERARGYLRKRQPFVWNATNLSPMVRNKQISLFTDYGAAVKIVYLETTWQEQLRRNRERADAVPEEAVSRMLETLVLPESWEARDVQWHCV